MFAQSMVYEPLVKYQTDGSVIPWLAKSWVSSADGKTWTFTLRDDVTFSNGEAFDAQAVAENFRAVLDNRQRHAWLELVNQIVDVKALSKTQLQITLKSAYYPFLQELALPRPFRFIAPSQFKDHETMHGIKAPIGTGPWVLKASKLNQYDVLVRNDHYWGEKPQIRQITVNVIPDPTTRAVAFETGEIDLLYGNEGLLPLDTFARFSQNPAYHTQLSQPIETVMLALNSNKAPTNELAVREALNHAVNKQSLVDNALYGTQQVADTLFATSVPYANIGLKPRQYDPQLAKALLEKAGWMLPAGKVIREKNGQPLRIELSFIGTDALSKSMAEIIQGDMRQIGVDVALVGEEESSIYARQRDGRFGMIFNRTWGAPYDPHAFMSSMRVPSHADYQAQQGLADKPIIDKEIGEVLETTDQTRRQALYRDILTRLHNDAVYLPISYVSMMVVAKPELGTIPYAPIASEIPFEQIKRIKP
jgi:nickel ABC transporter, nickel/metallophore periplasmic binding protein